MAELHLRFDKELEGKTLAENEGVLTNIYPATSAASKSVQTLGSRGARGITIPVGKDENYRVVSLDPGNYQVECILPSGQIVTEDVELVEGRPEKLVLRSADSPPEWLSWQQYSGNLSKQQSFGRPATDRDRSLATSVKELVESASPTVDLEVFDPSHRSAQALEASANSMWRDLLVDGATESSVIDGGTDIREPLKMIRSLVLSGLFEIAEDPVRHSYFEREKQWDTINQLTSGETKQPLADLMSRCAAAQQSGTATDGISWLSPYRSDQQVSAFRPTPGKGPRLRHFLVWTPAGGEFIVLPREWVDIATLESVPIDVMVDVSDADRQYRTSVTVHDTALSSALAYLTGGMLPTAAKLIAQARDMLFVKFDNPYAAAVGAYILLDSRSPDMDQSWMGWIENLHSRFEWLSDSSILYACLQLRLGRLDAAREGFKAAFQCGLPLYSKGLTKLVDGLGLFAQEDSQCADMHKCVRRVSWRTNVQQIFTVVRLGSSTTRKQLKSEG